METIEAHDWDGCLMCAVRALTQGRPLEWNISRDRVEGDTVTGVLLRRGNVPSNITNSPVPFIDLWTGGVNRIRVTAYGIALRNAIEAAEIEVGDTVTVRFDGDQPLPPNPRLGRTVPATYKAYTVTVERGHH